MPSRTSYQSTQGSSSAFSLRTASPSPSTSTSKTSTHLYVFRPRRIQAPLPLITTTNFESLPPAVESNHACIYFARQMSSIHNIIIRALNASQNHCLTFMAEEPKSPDSMAFVDPDPGLTHIANFLAYNQLIFKMLDHHHHVEGEFLFQQIEDLLVGAGQPRASMQGNVAQHQAFESCLGVFRAYVFKTQPAEFKSHILMHIIKSLAPILI